MGTAFLLLFLSGIFAGSNARTRVHTIDLSKPRIVQEEYSVREGDTLRVLAANDNQVCQFSAPNAGGNLGPKYGQAAKPSPNAGNR